MDDQSLNRELQSALNVDPSPEFLARVRTRIGAEPAPSRWRLAWLTMPAVAAIVLVVMLWPRSEAPAPVRVEPAAAPIAAADRVPVVESRPERAEAAPVRRAVRAAAAARQAPLIVVNTTEAAAFERLVARIEMGNLPAGADAVMAPDLPIEVDIAPIAFVPIAFAAGGEEGELQ